MKFVFKQKSLLSFGFLFIVLFITSCSVGDSSSPGTITDLTSDPISRLLDWTAPGDNGDQGRATIYFIRFYDNEEVAAILGVPSLDGVPFVVIEEAVRDNFNGATQIPDFQQPDVAGSPQSFLAPRLDITGEMMFFYSIRTNDEVGNSSKPSNVAEISTPLDSVKYVSSEAGSCIGESIGEGNFDGEQDDNGEFMNDYAIGDPCLGKVYIFFGANDLTDNGSTLIDVSAADVTVIGNPNDLFGASLAGIPDFDKDIRAQELVIGAPGFDNERGKVYVIFGSRDLPSVIDLSDSSVDRIEVVGENVGDNFGFSVADGDDVTNGSGLFLVGAPSFGSDTGRAYLFRGKSLDQNEEVPATDAGAMFTGQASGDLFGFDLANLGRIRSNSFDEFGAGAPGAGKAYVIFGQDNIQSKDLAVDTTNVVTLEGNAADSFGVSISGNGDIDEDGEGTPDVVVGAPDSNMSSGSVFLYSGEDIDTSRMEGTIPGFETEFTGIASGDRFGTSVGVIANLTPLIEKRNRDTAIVLILEVSNADFGVGAPGTENGRVYLFFGRDNFPVLVSASEADIDIPGGVAEVDFGIEVLALGDVNGDTVETNNGINLGFEDFGAGGSEFMRVFY
jgi:hypothetical protein